MYLSVVTVSFHQKIKPILLSVFRYGKCSEEDALLVFHVGLLCAQALPNLRPPMWKVVEMLSSRDKELPRPTQPPFINVKGSSNILSNPDK